jgi:type IV secretion system protein VirB1
MEMMACQNLAVPVAVMQHIVDVESGYNPFAIGVVGAHLERQPQNLGEALATAHMLESKGYNFSLGLAQVNRSNLGKYGLDSYEKAFAVCPNLSAGARILSECYTNSGGDWGKSFSCYYSGDFVTGYRDGYVQKVYASIGQSTKPTGDGDTAAAIPLQLVNERAPSRISDRNMAPMTPDSPGYRVAIRSVALDTAAKMAVMPAMTTAAGLAPDAEPVLPTPQAAPPQTQTTSTARPADAASATAGNAALGVFVPQVHGPNDPPQASSAMSGATAQVAAPSGSAPATDQADLRKGNGDDAFVF